MSLDPLQGARAQFHLHPGLWEPSRESQGTWVPDTHACPDPPSPGRSGPGAPQHSASLETRGLVRPDVQGGLSLLGVERTV